MITPQHREHDRAKQVLEGHLARYGLTRRVAQWPELILALRDAAKELAKNENRSDENI